MSTNLKSCPNPFGIYQHDVELYHTGYDWNVKCHCGVQCGGRATKEQAIEAWNERPTARISDFDAETRKVIYLANIVTKFDATLDRMGKLRDAVVGFQAKHQSERALNLITALFGTEDSISDDWGLGIDLRHAPKGDYGKR